MNVYIRIAAVMFLNFFIWGSWYVTAGLVLSKHGLGSEIGNLYSLAPFASLLTPFLVGYLVDRFFSPERVLALLSLVGALLLWNVPHFIERQDGNGLLWLVFTYTLCFMPTLNLTNNIAFGQLGNAENFPYLRIFANVGWILPGLFIGELGLSESTQVFQVAALASLVLGLLSLTLPRRLPNKGEVSNGVSLKDGLRLLQHKEFVILLLCMTLISVPLSFYYAYTATFADAVGFKNVGTVMTVGQLSDLVAIALIPWLIVRLGYKWMIFIAMAAWVIRYAIYSLGAMPPSLELVFVGIAIHGVCYDFLFVTAFIYTEKIAGPAAKGQAQGLVMFFTYGLGMLIGGQIAGYLYNLTLKGNVALDLASWQSFWLYPMGLAAVAAVVHLLGFKSTTRQVSKTPQQQNTSVTLDN